MEGSVFEHSVPGAAFAHRHFVEARTNVARSFTEDVIGALLLARRVCAQDALCGANWRHQNATVSSNSR